MKPATQSQAQRDVDDFLEELTAFTKAYGTPAMLDQASRHHKGVVTSNDDDSDVDDVADGYDEDENDESLSFEVPNETDEMGDDRGKKRKSTKKRRVTKQQLMNKALSLQSEGKMSVTQVVELRHHLDRIIENKRAGVRPCLTLAKAHRGGMGLSPADAHRSQVWAGNGLNPAWLTDLTA